MGEVKAAANKPNQFITKTLNNLVSGFIKWVSTVTMTIVVASFIFAAIADGCHVDNGTFNGAKRNMATAFDWWADGMHKFSDMLDSISDLLY